MPNVLFSIKSAYAKEIFSGRKRFEFRKRRCACSIDRILIYETLPVGRITGEVKVSGQLYGSPASLWQMTFSDAGISKDVFDQYFTGNNSGVAYVLTDPICYQNAISLASVGLITAPQSYYYLSEDVYMHIRQLAIG